MRMISRNKFFARRFQLREMTRQMTPRREIPKSGTRLDFDTYTFPVLLASSQHLCTSCDITIIALPHLMSVDLALACALGANLKHF